MKRTAVIVAMREEEKALLAPLEGKPTVDPRLRIFLTGIGYDRAAAAARDAITAFQPETVVSVGFGGAVSADLRVGDLVRGESFYRFGGGIPAAVNGVIPAEPIGPERLGTIVTTETIVDKESLRRLFPESPVVVDMETTAVAEAAREAGIQFLAVRAISDDPRDVIPFSADEILDRNGQVSPLKVLLLAVRRPRVAAALPRLYSSSKAAAGTLSTWFARFVRESGYSSG